MTEPHDSPVVAALRRRALRLPDVEAGESCVNQAFRVHGKAFAYLGAGPKGYKLMVKLDDSLDEAAQQHANRPDSFDVGKHGWVTVRLALDEREPALERWLVESHALMAPPATKQVAETKRKTAAKRAAKK